MYSHEWLKITITVIERKQDKRAKLDANTDVWHRNQSMSASAKGQSDDTSVYVSLK